GIATRLEDCWIFLHGSFKIQSWAEVLGERGDRGTGMRHVVFGLLGPVLAGLLAGSPALEAGERTAVTFERNIETSLQRAGFNAGACHGKARGQNGFALSLLAFDPGFDYDAIVKEARGRRVFPATPDESLLLRKASARVPHGGGLRLEPGSAFYETVRGW